MLGRSGPVPLFLPTFSIVLWGGHHLGQWSAGLVFSLSHWVKLWSLSCVRLCDPMDYSRPDSSVHGFFRRECWVGCHFLLHLSWWWLSVTWVNEGVGAWLSFFFLSFLNWSRKYRLAWWLSGTESTWRCKRRGFNPQVGQIPWRRKWQPTPVLLPGESHGWRSLADYIVHRVTRVGHDWACTHGTGLAE